jgi:cytochrome P450
VSHVTIMDAGNGRPPIRRVSTAAGDPAWLVSGYDELRKLFMDPELGKTHAEPERAARYSRSVLLGGPVGDDPSRELRSWTRARKHTAPLFSARRMSEYAPNVRRLAEELTDTMLAAGSPGDLHKSVTLPLSSRVMCELVGVPWEDEADFQLWSTQAADLTDPDLSLTGLTALWTYLQELVEHRRKQPREDGISRILASAAEDPDFTPDEVAKACAGFVFAGYEQTAMAMDNALLALLTHSEQYEQLRRDRTGLASALEELLRHSTMPTPGYDQPSGVCRYAHQDLSIAGVTVDTGELLILDVGTANLDDTAFTDPDRLDLTRTPNPHLTFGHGTRYCVGAPLARIELQSVLTALLDRIPAPKLTVPARSLRYAEGKLVYGLQELPIAW